jgi:hypothetical protein
MSAPVGKMGLMSASKYPLNKPVTTAASAAPTIPTMTFFLSQASVVGLLRLVVSSSLETDRDRRLITINAQRRRQFRGTHRISPAGPLRRVGGGGNVGLRSELTFGRASATSVSEPRQTCPGTSGCSLQQSPWRTAAPGQRRTAAATFGNGNECGHPAPPSPTRTGFPASGTQAYTRPLCRMHGPRLRRSLLGADRSYRFRP